MEQLLAPHWVSSPVERLEYLQSDVGRFTRTIDQMLLTAIVHEQNAAEAQMLAAAASGQDPSLVHNFDTYLPH